MKTYLNGTQKNCLKNMVILSTQSICYELLIRIYLNFTLKSCAYLDLPTLSK